MKKEGMSLITLAITVVVLIIVTQVTIVGIEKTGVIDSTQMIVEDMNLKNLEQLANTAYSNIYFQNLFQGIRREITGEEIRGRMLKDGADVEELSKYDIMVENGDVFVTLKEEE